MKRSLLLTLCVSAAAALLFFRQSTSQAQITNPQPAPPATELQSMTLVFGAKDMEPAKWDGSVSISKGSIEKITGYHFTRDSRVNGLSWTCSTHPWAAFSGGMHPNEKPQPQPTMVETIGVNILFRAPADALLTVKVPKGEFSFHPMDVPEAEGIFPLGATVEVYRTPLVEQVTGSDFENDYPALAADGNSLWLSWQGYKNENDQVFLRQYSGGTWGQRITVTDKPADIFMSGVSASKGKATVVWSERDGANWRLQARTFGAGGPGKIETLTTGPGSNLFHRVATDRAGNAHVAYQSWRTGRSDIYLRSSAGGKWSNEVKLSESPANDWNPSIGVDRAGTVWVAWDSYDTGAYNIFLRGVKNGSPGELLRVTNSTRFHAHPSLAVDAQDRVWIAYDEAPENWGKDVGFLLSGGAGLYDSRTIKVAVYAAGRWMTPLRQPGDVVPYGFRRYYHSPRLVADSAGRIWLFSRPRTSARLPTTLWGAGGKWEVLATYYSGDRWSDLLLIPDTVGRNEGEFQAAADASGNVFLALVSDHRLWGGANFGEPPQNNDIMFTRLSTAAPAAAHLGARPQEPPAGLPSEPREKEQVARMRGYTIANGGRNYKIYRGDMHRHTDISADGAGDGSLFDAYRYTMDAAAMDYFGLTDHQSGTQEYTWWRTQKSADMFNVQGIFTALFATERSLNYPNGHRNLMFAQRGVHILPVTPAEQKSSTGPVLYPYLKKNGGIAMSHTSHTTMGTDWRDNDPALEPIVEIFQGARTSAEHEGAPLAPTEKRTELWAGNYRPLGFVWNAWARGYKLGVQASSDHVSTHLSYACIIAENSSRQGLIDAMRQRHTYAATSNILLDYRLSAGGKTYLQGEDLAAQALPELTAKIVGTGPLKKVVVVRDNEYVFSTDPKGESFDLRFKENSLSPGQHYYYVRVEQQDGNVAWSSPIWIKYQ
ncbi:MAG TPA: hypothetical protein VL285_16895 [Bryobacteraceae bacterium]|nr:hypothetical protein [Bryobacteraceae bacterium]